MEPTPEGLKEFKKIYKEEYGTDLTDEEANKEGSNLLNFFKLLIEIDRRNKKVKEKDDK